MPITIALFFVKQGPHAQPHALVRSNAEYGADAIDAVHPAINAAPVEVHRK